MSRDRLVPLTSLDPQEIARWEELEDAAAEPNPFFSARAATAAARLLRGGDRALLAVAEDQRGWLGCVPVVRGYPARSPRPAPLASCWRHQYAFLGTPLLRRDAPERAAAGLLRATRRARGVAALAIPTIPAGGPAHRAFEAAGAARPGAPRVVKRFERAFVRGAAPPAEDAELVGRRRRRSLARRLRRLEERAGPVEVRDRSGEPASADEFLRLERLGWKGRAGTAMACRDGDAEYLRAVLAGAVGGAPPEVLALEAGGTAVAMLINFNVNGASFVFKAAYDPAFAKYSPGVHLELHHLGRIHAGAYEFSDSCSDPSDAFVNDLWPHRRAIVDIVAPVVPVAGAAVARAVEVAEAVRRPVRAARASRRKDPRAADDD